jgi:hypothetical protein
MQNASTASRLDANVIALSSEQPAIEIVEGQLHIHSFVLDGTIVELAAELGISEQPQELARLLRQVCETGAIVVSHGQRRVAVDALAGEIDRLVETTAAESGKLPAVVQEKLGEHLMELGTLLESRFDPTRTSSVQHQIKELVKGSTSEQVRSLLSELFGERGPLASSNKEITEQLKLVVGTSTDAVAKVTSLIDRLEQKKLLDDQQERSTHKGARFEEQVEIELIAIHGRLGDDVRCVKHETGLIPGSKNGDFVVTINTAQTGGLEARFVVEAKAGHLSGPQAQLELKEAMENRGAQAGILVFDGVADAPLRGRQYMAYPDGKIVAVLDDEHGVLGFEVACIQARLFALAAVAADGDVDARWVVAQCDKLANLVEDGSKIKRNTAAARRSLDSIDQGYDDLREQAFGVLDETRAKLA